MPTNDSSTPHSQPIEGELDLHTFRPSEAVEVVEAFLEESQARGFETVRVVHGKGTGTLREAIHACLRRSTLVARFRLGDERSGGWGATLVNLKPIKKKG